MAKSSSASILFLLLLSLISDGSLRLVNAEEQKTWCVAKPSSEEGALIENIDFACREVDCKILNEGGACYSPNNLINHASVAMNLYYQCKGKNYWNCDFKNSALVSVTDPSYGDCKYKYA